MTHNIQSPPAGGVEDEILSKCRKEIASVIRFPVEFYFAVLLRLVKFLFLTT